jgi:serine phosphatase RsbU (regulator of sigma subunit)/ActR/RegA family two-component response regulator
MTRIKVLLVEDNSDHGFLSLHAFKAHENRFDLVIAESAEKALALVKAGRFDVVFVDLRLPDAHGLDVMKDIHALNPGLPVIIITGQGSEELAVSTFRQGAVDYIIKNQNYFALLPAVAERIYESTSGLKDRRRRPLFGAGKVYDQILTAGTELLGAHASSLMIFNKNKDCLEIKAHRGLSQNFLSQGHVKSESSGEHQAVFLDQPVRLDFQREATGESRAIAGAEGIRSALSVPFTIDGSTRGVLNFYSRGADQFEPRHESLASELVKLSTLALQNLKLYYREHYIAETLQRSHFPDIDRSFGDWETAHRYKVSMEEAMLGGDFYDMFRVAGGRQAVVVADVSGKGINAAAQTAMVKYTLRSYALDDPDPATVLRRTHEAFCASSQTEHFVTVFYGVLDPKEKSISYCSAGHPPALFFSGAQKRVFDLPEVCLPVGVWHENIDYSPNTIGFEPGDALLIYTDGLTDCRKNGRRDGEFFGQSSLEPLFGSVAHQPAEAIADAVFKRILSFTGGKMWDDVAFFVLKLNPSR